LRDAGIPIPFPQRDVHIQNQNDVHTQTARSANQRRETRDREDRSEK
jgi:small-conductance mechanosensitive channel